MKARIRYTNVISTFTYNPIHEGFTCNEDARDNKILFAPYELVEIK